MHQIRKNWKHILSVILLLLLLTDGTVWVHQHAYATGVTPKAVTVYGQGGSFTSSTSGATSTTLSGIRNTIVDSSGNLYVADYNNNRVLYYAVGSTTATRVYGQNGSFTSNLVNNTSGAANTVSSTSLHSPTGLALDNSGDLYVVDTANSRVLYYAVGSTTATRVYGQAGSFTSNSANNGGVSTNSLNWPNNIDLDNTGNLYVADTGNNRVLYYAANSTTATRVYGQNSSYTSSSVNNTNGTANTLSTTSLNQPFGVTLDNSGNVYIADSGNNRILYYAGTSTTATAVYGQSLYTTNATGISPTALNDPTSIDVDASGNLYAADFNNNRVLYYAVGSTTATRVYGQNGSFTSNLSNNTNGTGSIISAAGFNAPYGVTADNSGNIYVSDAYNNRVLLFQTSLSVTTQPPASPSSQATFSTAATLIDVGSGATFSDFTGTVSVTIRTGTGVSGAVLSGTTSASASSGVATFSTLSINLSSAGYMLALSSPGVGSATTNAFIIGSLAPAGYWKLDDGSGTTASNSSGNSNPGTITGSGTSWTTAGKVNGALTFTGSTGTYVSMGAPTALQFGTGSFTIMSWFQTSSTAFQRMADMGMDSWDTGFELSFDESNSCPSSTTGCVTAAIGGGSSATSLTFGSTLHGLNDGTWHSAALVVDQTANTVQLYIDGTVQPVTIPSGFCTSWHSSDQRQHFRVYQPQCHQQQPHQRAIHARCLI